MNEKFGRDGIGGPVSHTSPSSPSSPLADPARILPPRGDYHTLLTFHKAEVIGDLTFRFAHKPRPRLEKEFLDHGGLRERMTRARLCRRGR